MTTIPVGLRRIRPGNNGDAMVDVEEMQPCPCEHCPMERHWMRVGTMKRVVAERHVAAHNRCLERA